MPTRSWLHLLELVDLGDLNQRDDNLLCTCIMHLFKFKIDSHRY